VRENVEEERTLPKRNLNGATEKKSAKITLIN
jgi:hypothetical protein